MSTDALHTLHQELAAELIARDALCSWCHGARILVNNGVAMAPGHGWGGPVKRSGVDEDESGLIVVDIGEAVECKCIA